MLITLERWGMHADNTGEVGMHADNTGEVGHAC